MNNGILLLARGWGSNLSRAHHAKFGPYAPATRLQQSPRANA